MNTKDAQKLHAVIRRNAITGLTRCWQKREDEEGKLVCWLLNVKMFFEVESHHETSNMGKEGILIIHCRYESIPDRALFIK